MIMKLGRQAGLGVVLGFVMLYVACGSSGDNTPRKKKEGRIYLRNETGVTMEVSYLHEEEGQIDTTVEPDEEKDISQAVLAGGTEVVVHVRALQNNEAKVEIPITVDGNRIIRITGTGSWGGGGLDFELQ